MAITFSISAYTTKILSKISVHRPQLSLRKLMYRLRQLKQSKLFVTTMNTTQYLPTDFALSAGANALSVTLRWTWVIFKSVRIVRKDVYVIVRTSVSPYQHCSQRTDFRENLKMVSFMKISRTTRNLVKMRQKYRVFHMQP